MHTRLRRLPAASVTRPRSVAPGVAAASREANLVGAARHRVHRVRAVASGPVAAEAMAALDLDANARHRMTMAVGHHAADDSAEREEDVKARNRVADRDAHHALHRQVVPAVAAAAIEEPVLSGRQADEPIVAVLVRDRERVARAPLGENADPAQPPAGWADCPHCAADDGAFRHHGADVARDRAALDDDLRGMRHRERMLPPHRGVVPGVAAAGKEDLIAGWGEGVQGVAALASGPCEPAKDESLADAADSLSANPR